VQSRASCRDDACKGQAAFTGRTEAWERESRPRLHGDSPRTIGHPGIKSGHSAELWIPKWIWVVRSGAPPRADSPPACSQCKPAPDRRSTYLVARGGPHAAPSCPGHLDGSDGYPGESAPEPRNSQSSAPALLRAAEPAFQNRTRRLREPISGRTGGGACHALPSPSARLQNPVRRFSESNQRLSGYGGGVSSRALPSALLRLVEAPPSLTSVPRASAVLPSRMPGGAAFLPVGAAVAGPAGCT
jgi:hypothetical protein